MIKTMLWAASAALIPLMPAHAMQVAQDAPNEAADEAAFESAMAHNNVMTVRNVTRTELVRDLWIFDAAGKPIGQVDHLSGNDVILRRGARQYVLSFTDMFAYNQYGKDYFATRQTKEALELQASSSGQKTKTPR